MYCALPKNGESGSRSEYSCEGRNPSRILDMITVEFMPETIAQANPFKTFRFDDREMDPCFAGARALPQPFGGLLDQRNHIRNALRPV